MECEVIGNDKFPIAFNCELTDTSQEIHLVHAQYGRTDTTVSIFRKGVLIKNKFMDFLCDKLLYTMSQILFCWDMTRVS